MAVAVAIYGAAELLIFFVPSLASDKQGALIRLVATVVVLPPTLSIVVRRLHDFGWRAGWALLALIPIVGLGFVIYFGVRRGDLEINSFGVPSANKH